MFKKLLTIFLFIVILVVFFTIPREKKKDEPNNDQIPNSKQTPITKSKTSNLSRSVFLPYWIVEDEELDVADYERVIYFGIAPTRENINKEEAGYLGLSTFVSNRPQDKIRYLTLRMIDSDTNLAILKNSKAQDNIIYETIETAIKGEFSGIVLDLELFSIFDDKVPIQINNFVKKFYAQTKQSNLKLVLTIYGDVFYRKRPYDVATLAKNADEIIIMAYDFHKSRGEPGANFPLKEFQIMIDEFLVLVPKEKLTVAFGMFGYDWFVDKKGRPIRPAKSLTLNQIHKKFPAAVGEKEWRYRDAEGEHIIWFEDEKSVGIKSDYLLQKGINKTAFWAYGYY